MSFKPCYVWPNEYFPFRLYFKNKKLTILIIDGIVHNFNWLNEWKNKIDDSFYFFVIAGWYMSEWHAFHYDQMFDYLNLEKDNFFFLFNSEEERKNLTNKGFVGDIINQNCWIDEKKYNINPSISKKYDALLIARKTAFKRHYLACKVRNLALISSGYNDANNVQYDMPKFKYESDHKLNYIEICEKINESYCGLALSAEEGACYSSSECLLCGTPMVSTKSLGGRDLWYDEYNSIVCDSDTAEDVAEAVLFFKNNQRDPQKIRNKHIEQANKQRQKFIDQLDFVFKKYNVDIDAKYYFKMNYIDKMIKIQKPNFSTVFNYG
jgi:glycosyltransferase involved in cell wall biosynthesis